MTGDVQGVGELVLGFRFRDGTNEIGIQGDEVRLNLKNDNEPTSISSK